MLEKCVWRLSPASEIIVGTFDYSTGIIREYPDVVNLQINDYFEGRKATINLEDLVDVLLMNSEALMVIAYGKVGAYIVYPDKIVRWAKSIPLANLGYIKLEKSPFLLKPYRVLGMRGVKLLTYNRLQGFEQLVSTLDADNKEKIYSNRGIFDVPEGMEELLDFQKEAYIQMYSNNKFAYGKQNGELVTIHILNRQLITEKLY